MKQFYQSTYYLWIVTKGLFAVAGFISALSNLGISNLTGPEMLSNFIALVYAVLLAVDIVMSLRRNYSKALKYTTGTISVLSSVVILILPFLTSVISVPITLLFATWLMLLGFFDLLVIRGKSLEDEE